MSPSSWSLRFFGLWPLPPASNGDYLLKTVKDGGGYFNASSVSDVTTFTHSCPYEIDTTHETLWFANPLSSSLNRPPRNRQLGLGGRSHKQRVEGNAGWTLYRTVRTWAWIQPTAS